MAAILAGMAAALAYQAWRVGVTVDEPSHLVSARLYWRGADRLSPHDVPPLMKAVGGWVPRLFDLPLPADLGRPGDRRHEWDVGLQLIERLKGPRIQRLFFYSRLPLLVFPLLTAVLIWRWGRRLFRPEVGVLLALAFALEPTALAHGALFKNDLAATFGYLLFWYAAWCFWRAPRPKTAAGLGAAVLVAILTKMSMLFLAGVAPLLVAARYATRPRPRLRPAAAALVLVLLIPYLGSLAACQFDTRRLPAAEVAAYAKNPALPIALRAVAHVFRILPVPWPMWQGCVTLAESNSSAYRIYLLGDIVPRGSFFYFLVALAVKIPLPLQLLIASGLLLAARAALRRRFRAPDVLWLAPGLLYVALASCSSLQLGVRLVLPALPFGLLLSGMALDRLWAGRGRLACVLFVVWLAGASASIYPHGITFFNAWAGGPEHGLRYLADSNVDWGQALPDLADYVRAHGIPKPRLSYFGTDSPWRYFGENEIELLAPPWGDSLARGNPYRPEPGYYAISATLLPGQHFDPKYQDYFRVFREMQPIARPGNSFYLYKVDGRMETADKRR